MANKKKYYSTKSIKKEPFDYALIWGQKDNGKSYAVKNEIIPDFLLNGREFVYIRRFKDEVTQFKVESQFNDYPIEKVSNGEFTRISAYQHRIFFGTDKEPKQCIAGYYFSLDEEQDYAGIQLPHLGNLFFDEFFSRTYYLPNEPYRLMLLISTLARDNKPKVWLCGNNVSKLCPYTEEWGLQEMLSQRQGTIFHAAVDDANGKPTIIAVERCAETGGENSLIIGKDAAHIAKGEHRIKQAPHLPKAVETYKELYTFVIEREKLRFLCHLFEDKDIGPFIYVTPKTSEIQPNTRIITDNLFRGGELVTYGLRPVSLKERVIFELLDAGKVCYSDNTTARDFSNTLKSFKLFDPYS